jgi:23S rRNA pseudouridine1911/1915/1917 synthase
VKSGADYRDAPPDDAPQAPVETRRWIAGADDHACRLDKVLALHAPEFSRGHLQHLIADGRVTLDDQPCLQSSRRVRAGQAVSVALVPTAQALAFRPQPMALPIVFEDAHLLVVDKPAGLVVHPGAGNWSGTLLNGLLAHHAEAANLPRAGIVHRLDKGTSGLMVVGKTLACVTELVRAIAAREVAREYAALVHGTPRWRHQTFESPIGRDPRSALRMAVVAGGRPARTDAWCLASSGGLSAIVCRLHTGRTHQIRVHLSHAGHPLVADELYGGRIALGIDRPALHARRLGFRHPATHHWMSFESELPPGLQQAWREVAGDARDPDGAAAFPLGPA